LQALVVVQGDYVERIGDPATARCGLGVRRHVSQRGSHRLSIHLRHRQLTPGELYAVYIFFIFM